MVAAAKAVPVDEPKTGKAAHQAASRPTLPAKGWKSVKPVMPVVAVSSATVPVAASSMPAVPLAEVVALDQRIAKVRETMNQLATDLSTRRIELAGLREQRRAFGPAPRSRRDPDAPRRPTLLDAAAQVLADAGEPMQAKAIWRAIVERDLWSTSSGGKTPFATLAAAMMRDVVAKGAASRFVKAGRGLFNVIPARARP